MTFPISSDSCAASGCCAPPPPPAPVCAGGGCPGGYGKVFVKWPYFMREEGGNVFILVKKYQHM